MGNYTEKKINKKQLGGTGRRYKVSSMQEQSYQYHLKLNTFSFMKLRKLLWVIGQIIAYKQTT